jgi:hypothetical protein
MASVLETKDPENWKHDSGILVTFLNTARKMRRPVVAEKILEPYILPILRNLPEPPMVFFKQVINTSDPQRDYIIWNNQTTLDYVHPLSEQEEKPITLDSFV